MTFLLATLLLSAQEPDTTPVPFVIEVRDDAGKPAAGAAVTVYGLRDAVGVAFFDKDQPKTSYAVRTTDDAGRASFEIPAFFRTMPGAKLLFYATHPRLAGRRMEAPLDAESADGADAVLPLAPGTSLRIMPVLERGEPDFGTALFIAPGMEVPSEVTADGDALVTPPLREDAPIVRLRIDSTDGVRHEGEWLAWTPDPGRVTDLPMALAACGTVSGRLSDDVPRPVRGGWLQAKYTAPSFGQKYAVLGEERMPVGEDGRFELPNVPPGCDVQLIALCESHAWRSPADEEVVADLDRYEERLRPRPGATAARLFEPAEQTDGVVLPMAPSAAAAVRVEQPDGSPAADVEVNFNPNCFWVGDGNDMIAYKPAGSPEDAWNAWPNRTDAAGRLRVAPLPPLVFSVNQLTTRRPKAGWLDLSYTSDGAIRTRAGETTDVVLKLTEPLPE